MDVRQVVLTANIRTPIKVPGKFFMLIDTAAPLTVRFLKAFSTFREVARDVEAGYKSFPGDWTNPDDFFDGVTLTSATTQTVTIAISDRAGDYLRAEGLVDVTGPNDGDTTTDTTVNAVSKVVYASNANTRLVHVQNTGTVNNARVGPGVVTATRGVQLYPGQSVTLRTTKAINGIREGAADTTIGVTFETRT